MVDSTSTAMTNWKGHEESEDDETEMIAEIKKIKKKQNLHDDECERQHHQDGEFVEHKSREHVEPCSITHTYTHILNSVQSHC